MSREVIKILGGIGTKTSNLKVSLYTKTRRKCLYFCIKLCFYLIIFGIHAKISKVTKGFLCTYLFFSLVVF